MLFLIFRELTCGLQFEYSAELVDAFVSRDGGFHDWDGRPGCGKLLHDIGGGLIGPGEVGLVDYDDVGDFQDAGFFPLQFVAGLRLQHEDHDIGHPANRDVVLAGADGFDKHAIELKRLHHVEQELDVGRDALLSGGGGQTSNKDLLGVGAPNDATAVTQQGAARDRAFGITCEDSDALAALGEVRRHGTQQAALADTAAAGEGDHRCIDFRKLTKCGRQGSVPVSQCGQGQQPRQRSARSLLELANQVCNVVALRLKLHEVSV
jgi:hypothetical protein